MHIAVFDAVNAIVGGYTSYTVMPTVSASASVEAAIGKAAHDTMVAMLPSQADHFDQELALDLARIPDGKSKTDGIAVGRGAAANILRRRARTDGSTMSQYSARTSSRWTSQDSGDRTYQPRAAGAGRLVVQSEAVRHPFGRVLRVQPPPALTSRRYAAAYNEVQRLGGDGIHTPTERTEEQTFIGTFWAYDGYSELVRAAASLQSDRDDDCCPDGHNIRHRAGATSRARECLDGRCGPCLVGVEIPLSILAPDHGHPRI